MGCLENQGLLHGLSRESKIEGYEGLANLVEGLMERNGYSSELGAYVADMRRNAEFERRQAQPVSAYGSLSRPRQ